MAETAFAYFVRCYYQYAIKAPFDVSALITADDTDIQATASVLQRPLARAKYDPRNLP